MIVNELITKLKFRNDPQGAKRHEDSMKRMTKEADRFFRRNSSLASGYKSQMMKMLYGTEKAWRDSHGRMRTENGQFISRASTGLGRLTKRFGPLTKAIGGAVAAYAGFNAVKNFTSAAFEATGNKQMLMSRLTTVLGSDAAAVSKYKMMSKFAEVTPYQKNDLVGGFASIAGSGYQLTERDLTALGDVSAGSGKKTMEPMIEMLKSANRGLGSMVDNFDGMKAKAVDGRLEMMRYVKATKSWVSASVEAGDMAGIVKFVRAHGEANYAGQMDKMSKTLPGMLSTLKDKISQRFEDIGNAGVDKLFTNMMKGLLDVADKMKPVAQRFGALASEYIPKTIEGIKALTPLLGPLALGFGLLGTHMLGLKTMLAFNTGKGLIGSLAKIGPYLAALFLKFKKFAVVGSMMLQMGGISALGPMLTAGASALAAALTPLLIGGAIVAAIGGVVWLGYQLYKYWTQGSKALDGMRERFPALAGSIEYLGDAMKEWLPHIKVAWANLKQIGTTVMNDVTPVFKDLFNNVLVPLLGWSIRRLGDFFKRLKIIYETAMPAMVQAFYFWKDGFRDVWDYIYPKVKWLIDGVGSLASGVASVFGGGSGGAGGSVNPNVNPVGSAGMLGAARQFAIGAPGQSAADKWAKSSRKVDGMAIKTLYKTGVACAASVEEIARQAGASQKVLSAMSPSAPNSYNNLLNQGLAELVPYDQLQGGEIFYAPDLSHTGIVGAGGKTFIHARNSKGKDIGMGQRFTSGGNYLGSKGKYLRIKQSEMPNVQGGAGGATSGGANVTLQQNFNGPANPQQVRNAALNGTQTAIHKAGLTKPSLVPSQ